MQFLTYISLRKDKIMHFHCQRHFFKLFCLRMKWIPDDKLQFMALMTVFCLLSKNMKKCWGQNTYLHVSHFNKLYNCIYICNERQDLFIHQHCFIFLKGLRCNIALSQSLTSHNEYVNIHYDLTKQKIMRVSLNSNVE